MDRKKRNVSIRLSESDIKKTKDVSCRLGVRESELFRFAIKNTLRKLMPLNEGSLQGSGLIPLWLVVGEELTDYFDLNVDQLSAIFNSEADSQKRIDLDDLCLMQLSGVSGNYVVQKLSNIYGEKISLDNATQVMKEYLYDKYVLGKAQNLSHAVGAY